ncbi:type ISP restriction/modification enzyme [Helicobacter pylori]|uniref:type ISP restriction/modification enzyme n=1 Tax=Helicobacter pylori TaxID=210 RepID=UPI001F0EC9E6|nr:type ISP restriction/modification enzyme [Helicobacter pylori]MCH4601877.1 DEAD/DEAH box helicase family protein [Helicobacter pylori]MCH4608472.1 DEAD/DEAH box helicase family protein [Helicobacter pylori]
MSEISTYKLIKEKLQAIPPNQKGSLFEKISKHFLKEHDSANEYESIDLWNDWELNNNEGDRGIDMVVTTTSKEYIAVQCKYHQNNISLNDIATFLTQLQSGVQSVVGKIRFKKGIIISTSNLSSNALKAIEDIRSNGMGIDIDEITEEDFIYSQIDWEKLDTTQSELPLCDKKKPRPHQTEAIEQTKEYFSDPKNTRGKLIMACGTGKTYTSLKIMESLDPKITLFLAPSIALLSQTFREYAQEKSEPFYASIVCSDDKVGKGKKNKSDDGIDDINFSELPLKPSTRLEDILSVHKKAQKENKRFIIFSTYQSTLRIKEAQEAGLNEIDLIICDESHRTVGAMYSSNERDDKNAFTLCHSDEHIKAQKRLYMTATPKVYSESSKAKAKESDNVIYSMDDAGIFGEEIYTLNFERAIALDLLTDYKVIILAVRSKNLSGVKRFNESFRESFKQRTKGVKPGDLYKLLNDKEITTDKTKISWVQNLKTQLIKGKKLDDFSQEKISVSLYRPFNKQYFYYERELAWSFYSMKKIFPDKHAQNVVINTGVGNGKDFSALVSDSISSLDLIFHNQAYPLYYYDGLGRRDYAISGWALNLFRKHYKDNAITEEEIFYYIYAILHHKGYLEKYKNSLKKEAPRIALSEDFKELSVLGKQLAELHLNYENGEMHESVKHTTLMNAEIEGYYDVEKMTKKGDSIVYNKNITITKIPKKAFDYVINGKSAIDWVIERYQKTIDEESLIENDPNDYAGGKYVLELLCRVIKLSEKSVDLIEKISEKRFE